MIHSLVPGQPLFRTPFGDASSMSDQHFLRCNCEGCGSPIEFPAQGVGLKIDCPHCGQSTLLSESAAEPATSPPLPSEIGTGTSAPASESDMPPLQVPQASSPGTATKEFRTCPSCGARREADIAFCPQCGHRKKSPLLAGALVLLVLAALAGGAWYFMVGPGAKKPELPVAKSAPTNPATNMAAGKPEPSNIATALAPAPAPVPKSPKSIDDLKPSAVTMEKAKSGSLIHAVGTIKNTSDQQRFGVRVELELTDARGNPAGKASDYTQVIEPRQEWRFRALVLDPKGARAVAGKVSSIKEDN